MIRNPELRRNLWLELTPHRLFAMPAVLLLAFVLAYVLGRREGVETAAFVALGLFVAMSTLWGSQLAANSIVDEFRDKTWDTQRMSSLGPWTLAWGKLAGANVFTWYGGAICIGAFVVFGALGDLDRLPIAATALLACGVAVLTHSLSMFLALIMDSTTSRRRTPPNIVVVLLLLMVFSQYLHVIYGREPTIWYGMVLDPTWFGVISIWLFAIWATVGVYRALCAELQVRTSPTAWLGFAAFLSLYFAGFAVGRRPGDTLPLFAYVGFFVTLSMTYLSAWWERRDIVTIRRFALHWRTSSRKRALQEMPCWLATAPFAIGLALFLALGTPTPPAPFDRLPAGFAFGLRLYALRDLGLLYFFSLARAPRRAELTTIVYLAVVYWLLPAIFDAAGLDSLAKLFLPPVWDAAPSGIGILLVHLAVVGGLLWWRSRMYRAGPIASP
jgi:hypothetical protein